MIKNLSSFILLLLFLNISLLAQHKQVSYHDSVGRTVQTREQSYYYRVIAPDERYPDLRKYKEYYTKGDRLKLVTRLTNGSITSSKIGECLTYYANGQLQEKQRFNEKNQLIDSAYAYYPNGQLYTLTLHKFASSDQRVAARLLTERNESSSQRIVEYILVKDSLGEVVVKNGTGDFPVFELASLVLLEQGPLLNHKKDGEWTGKSQQGTYKETWKNDKLIGGVIKDSLGAETIYNEESYAVPPAYPGGITALMRFVGNNYRYPSGAINAGVSGAVQIDFIVEKDGSMSSFKVSRDLGYGTGKAGVDVLKKANKKWSPGLQRGIPVRVAYTLPINLNLSK
ncbi:energy transducer TonB [Sphingobacterium deserti]|uniref:TonB family protein n=1 Tax=Sphingobacterium deserti TaxID=1229276 RepID=A0A0B8T2D6_9SPHI|nr:energy transducer TonB [Sphingobacterium deserti]KGE15422.1 TonB family protein [Sphingobacterium deserti]